MLHFLLVPVAAVTLATAQIETYMGGNTIYEDCSGKDGNRLNLCTGYILGVVDTYETQRLLQNRPRCTPHDADGKQLRDIVLSYLRDHPETRHESAPGLVADAVSKAFCPTM